MSSSLESLKRQLQHEIVRVRQTDGLDKQGGLLKKLQQRREKTLSNSDIFIMHTLALLILNQYIPE